MYENNVSTPANITKITHVKINVPVSANSNKIYFKKLCALVTVNYA